MYRPSHLQGLLRGTAALAALALLLAGCGGESGGGTTPIEPPPPPPPTGSIRTSVAPAGQSIPPGAEATVAITITREGGYTGAVTLAATGVPSGVTVSFAPATVPATSSSSTVTIRVAPGTTRGSQSFTVTAAGGGTITATPLTVGVTVVSEAVVRFCTPDAPLWVAVQDGDTTATWTRAATTGPNTYTISLSGARGAIARVDTVGALTQTTVAYIAADELATYGARINAPSTCGTNIVSVPFSGISFTGANTARVSIGPVTHAVTVLPFVLRNLVDGPVDLVASRYVNVFAGTIDRIVARRGLTLTSGQTLPSVDFTAAEAIAPDSGITTITNASSSTPSSMQILLVGDQGSSSIEVSRRDTVGILTQRNYALTASQLGPTSLQAAQYDEFGSAQTRRARRYFRTIGAQTLTLGSALLSATAERAATAPYVRPRIRLTGQGDYDRSVDARFATSTHAVQLTATSGYFGGAPGTWSLTLPDFSSVAGWQAGWGLGAGALSYRYGALGGVDTRFDASTVVDGAVMRAASTNTLTLP